jgi:hypothetical protein
MTRGWLVLDVRYALACRMTRGWLILSADKLKHIGHLSSRLSTTKTPP